MFLYQSYLHVLAKGKQCEELCLPTVLEFALLSVLFTDILSGYIKFESDGSYF